MLDDIEKSHDLLDDFESVFWSLLFLCLHRISHTNIGKKINIAIFDERARIVRDDNKVIYKGGEGKRNALNKIQNSLHFDCAPLTTLIHDLTQEFLDLYRLREIAELPDTSLNSTCDLGTTMKPIRLGDTSSLDEDEARLFARVKPKHAEKQKSKADRIKEARDREETLREPGFWMQRFKAALDSEGWPLNDAVTQSPYPQLSVKEQTHLFQLAAQSTLLNSITSAQSEALRLSGPGSTAQNADNYPPIDDQDIDEEVEDVLSSPYEQDWVFATDDDAKKEENAIFHQNHDNEKYEDDDIDDNDNNEHPGAVPVADKPNPVVPSGSTVPRTTQATSLLSGYASSLRSKRSLSQIGDDDEHAEKSGYPRRSKRLKAITSMLEKAGGTSTSKEHRASGPRKGGPSSSNARVPPPAAASRPTRGLRKARSGVLAGESSRPRREGLRPRVAHTTYN